jgi:hypothetical protein
MNRQEMLFDECLDYVWKQIHNSCRHEPHRVYIYEAVRKICGKSKFATEIEKDLLSLIAD